MRMGQAHEPQAVAKSLPDEARLGRVSPSRRRAKGDRRLYSESKERPDFRYRTYVEAFFVGQHHDCKDSLA